MSVTDKFMIITLRSIIILLVFLPLLGVAACSPIENVETTKREGRLEFRDGPLPIPIPPIDPVPPTNEKKIIIVPDGSAASPSTIDKMITTPAGALHFGLQEIDGSSLLSNCPGEMQAITKEKVCIKIPSKKTDKIWWQNQYIKQLFSLGWGEPTSIELENNIRFLSGKRTAECGSEIVTLRSQITVMIIDNEMVFDPENNVNKLLFRNLDGTYLLFMNMYQEKCPK